MKKLFLLSILCVSSVLAFAIDEVTLTTVGDGSSRDEAVKNALRSALEQAYGAFMSSSTIVLDDELQKDEIVSVTSGNIKSYKVLGYAEGGNGTITASCVSTVALNKLLDYMKSSGSEVNFSGASFAANMILEELNIRSEQKAIEHLMDALSHMRGLCDYELKLAEPQIKEEKVIVTGKVLFKFNSQGINYGVLIYNTLAQLNTPDGKYPVPNLGNFKLRSPLPEKFEKELLQYKQLAWQDYYHYGIGYYRHFSGDKNALENKYGQVMFMRDMLRFCIYDNIHLDIDEAGNDIQIQYLDMEMSTTDCKVHKGHNMRYPEVYPTVYLPYACIPEIDKMDNRSLRDDEKLNYEERDRQIRAGKVEVGVHQSYYISIPQEVNVNEVKQSMQEYIKLRGRSEDIAMLKAYELATRMCQEDGRVNKNTLIANILKIQGPNNPNTYSLEQLINQGYLVQTIISPTNEWWTQLSIPFYYRNDIIYGNRDRYDILENREMLFTNTYAEPGDIFAALPIVITIPKADIAKYTNFGVRYYDRDTEK